MIVAGYTYFAAPNKPEHVTIVGRGDRAHLDALVRRAPQELRPKDEKIVHFFRAFAEGQLPEFGRDGYMYGEPTDRAGGAYFYDGSVARADIYPKLSHAWWKQIDEVLP